MNLPALVMLCAPHIDPSTLLAIIAVESAANPHAVSINSPERLRGQGIEVPLLSGQPRNADEALQLIAALHASGLQVSVGLAQVNEIHLPALKSEFGVTALSDLLEPCTNLKAAAWVLQGCWSQVGSAPGDLTSNGRVHRALSCFNTGHAERGLRNGYVWRVFLAAQGKSPLGALATPAFH
ncbi:MAG: hypothetical protein AMXMBFR37_07080 [Steroidobacteraceae bacterium]|jgi:type IV secretion system protein VirB1